MPTNTGIMQAPTKTSAARPLSALGQNKLGLWFWHTFGRTSKAINDKEPE